MRLLIPMPHGGLDCDAECRPSSECAAAAASVGASLFSDLTILTPSLPSKYLQPCYSLRAFTKEGCFV